MQKYPQKTVESVKCTVKALGTPVAGASNGEVEVNLEQAVTSTTSWTPAPTPATCPPAPDRREPRRATWDGLPDGASVAWVAHLRSWAGTIRHDERANGMTAVPQDAQLSEDGHWWWDGNEWQPVEPAGDAPPQGTAQVVFDTNRGRVSPDDN